MLEVIAVVVEVLLVEKRLPYLLKLLVSKEKVVMAEKVFLNKAILGEYHIS